MPLGVLSGCQVLDTLLAVVCVSHRCLLEFLIERVGYCCRSFLDCFPDCLVFKCYANGNQSFSAKCGECVARHLVTCLWFFLQHFPHTGPQYHAAAFISAPHCSHS